MIPEFEIWIRDEASDSFVFQSGHCESGVDLEAAYASKRIRKGEGSIGQAWLTGVPAINEQTFAEDTSVSAVSAREAGMSRAVVLPVLKQGQAKAAVTWYL